MIKALINLFFPSWNFFNATDSTPLVYVQEENDEWRLFMPVKEVHFFQLFYNPKINLYLYYHSLIQKLINDIFYYQNDSSFDLTQNDFYIQLNNWIKLSSKQKKYRFKLIDTSISNCSNTIFETPFYGPY